jgi:hypothetical protein
MRNDINRRFDVMRSAPEPDRRILFSVLIAPALCLAALAAEGFHQLEGNQAYSAATAGLRWAIIRLTSGKRSRPYAMLSASGSKPRMRNVEIPRSK